MYKITALVIFRLWRSYREEKKNQRKALNLPFLSMYLTTIYGEGSRSPRPCAKCQPKHKFGHAEPPPHQNIKPSKCTHTHARTRLWNHVCISYESIHVNASSGYFWVGNHGWFSFSLLCFPLFYYFLQRIVNRLAGENGTINTIWRVWFCASDSREAHGSWMDKGDGPGTQAKRGSTIWCHRGASLRWPHGSSACRKAVSDSRKMETGPGAQKDWAQSQGVWSEVSGQFLRRIIFSLLYLWVYWSFFVVVFQFDFQIYLKC